MALTVGDIRKAIEGLPDTCLVFPDWAADSVPEDQDPGVELCWFERVDGTSAITKPYLSVVLKLFDLAEYAATEEA